MPSRRRQLVFENLANEHPRLRDEDSEAEQDDDSLEHTNSEQGTENSGADTSTSGVKNKRGPTRCFKIWTSNDKRAVTYDPLGHPVGGAAQELITFLGTVARKGALLPIDVPRWKLMKQENIDKAWNEITKRFTTDHPNAKKALLKLLRKKWNDWKVSLMKDFFIPGDRVATLEGPFKSDNPRVDEDQWAVLVEYWITPEFQKISERNKLARAKQSMAHTLGTKSYPRKKEEVKKQQGGVSPDRAHDLFVIGHTRKDGVTVVQSAASKVAEIKRRKLEASASGTVIETPGPNDILAQTLGKDPPGRVRAMGWAATASNTWGAKTYGNTEQVNTLMTKVNTMSTQMEEQRSVMDGQKAIIEEQKSTIEQQRKMMDEMAISQKRMEQMVTQLIRGGGITAPNSS